MGISLKTLILSLILGFSALPAQAYRCGANFLGWSHQDVLEKPLELYDRLQMRAKRSTVIELDQYEFIQKDLEHTKQQLIARLNPEHPFMNEDSAGIGKKLLSIKLNQLLADLELLRANRIPYEDLLTFYENTTLFLQNTYRFAADINDFGFSTSKKSFKEVRRRLHKSYGVELPTFILPIARDLSEADFVRTNGIPLYYAGVTFAKVTRADGIDMGPADFFIHDYSHAEFMNEFLRKSLRKAVMRDDDEALTIAKTWNQYAISQLDAATAQPLFNLMHEFFKPITPTSWKEFKENNQKPLFETESTGDL